LLDFFAVLDLFYKHLRWLESRDVMFFDHDSCVFGDVSGDFLSSFLVDEATKTSYMACVTSSFWIPVLSEILVITSALVTLKLF